GNYIWDCELQTGGASLGSSIPANIMGKLVVNKTGTNSDPAVYLPLPEKIKIDGSFILNGGTCAVKGANAAIELAGDFIMNGGNLRTNTAYDIGSVNINFNGNSTQVVSKTGGVISNTKFILLNNAVLDLGESVLDGDADFAVEAGGKLITSHPGGLALTGKTGAIQVTGQRKFSTEADYAYTGTKPQVTGTGLPSTVRRLIIDNKSGLVPGSGVTLSKATIISKQLMLNDGFLLTSSDNMLTIAGGADAIVSDNSFIAGPMRKTGNTPFTFPTGWAGGGRIPIGISFTGATATIQAEYKRASATDKGTTINAPLHHISYCEYWELFPVSGNPSAVITMYRNAYSSCNPVSYIDDFSSVRVARSNGASWTQIGNTYDSMDAGNGFVVSDNAGIAINSKERYFALGHITTAKDPLPVLFDSVLAYEKNEGVNVEWSNLTERDIAVYYVERSVNGIDFTLIGQSLPKSNRDDKARYTSFDGSPVAGTNFYRIKAIQKNTKIIFSKVMRIERGMAGQKLSLYPNPVVSNQITIGLLGLRDDKYNIRIVNAAGQHIYESMINYKGRFMTQTLRLPSFLKPGVYGLIVAGSDYRENKTFIVQ
ncbi:MAG: T9SS type A sorting domain-containing protein, partial [Chitinophagaceae bacterium]